MPKTPRVVLDTNILVSATIGGAGFPARILDAALEGQLQIVLSPYLLAEYIEVLGSPHIVRKHPKLAERAPTLTRFLRTRSALVELGAIERIVPEDPKDDAILATTVQGQADYVISGDEHLLALNVFRGIPILTPRDFATRLLA